MHQPPSDLRNFESLLQIVKSLRSPDGCPWDKEQTHLSLTPFAIEEAHELAEAIEDGDQKEMISELGDLLLQVALHAEIGRQSNSFDIHDVLYAVCEKMVRRHPHVFADTQVKDSTEVLANWAKIKEQEKAAQKVSAKTATDAAQMRFDVPLQLPALTRSMKIGGKTQKENFDWSGWQEVLPKVDEEILELKEALQNTLLNKERVKQELGDVLFSLAQLARHLDIEPEQALRQTNQRFEKRFFTMKGLAESKKQDFKTLSASEKEELWKQAKDLEPIA